MTKSVSLFLLLPMATFASVISFTDYTSWSEAANALPDVTILEGFNTPNLGFNTRSGWGPGYPFPGNGHLDSQQVWNDSLGQGVFPGYVNDTTVISYPKFYGFFANWQVNPGLSSGIEVDGFGTDTSFILKPFGGDITGDAIDLDGFSGTWGFISTLPIDYIILSVSSGGQGFKMETPAVADPPISPSISTPEPTSLLLVGMALTGAALIRRKIKH